MKDLHGKWVTENDKIVGILFNDYMWSVEEIYENPILHQLYHSALKEHQDERNRQSGN